jgi:hypothetical protein
LRRPLLRRLRRRSRLFHQQRQGRRRIRRRTQASLSRTGRKAGQS